MKVNNIRNSYLKFDTAYPLHTWYPLFSNDIVKNDYHFVYKNIDKEKITDRALYFHIPFCEDRFCAFCSFNRQIKKSDDEIQNYVNSLIKEIHIKSRFKSISEVPVKAIFFGGGTPSVMTADQIIAIGQAIHNCFDLSKLKEFSFENNICSITEEKLKVLKKIGVTHVRAGVQTLNQKYREFFNLRPTNEEIKEKILLMKQYFENVCIDIIYGINGQDIDEFIYDIDGACKLNTKLIDFYPLTQPKGNMQLHKLFTEKKLAPHTELTLIGYKNLLREITKQYGYAPHNGHGFVNINCLPPSINKNKTAVSYVFEYHKCLMGYSSGDVVGFGAGAISGYFNYSIQNESNIIEYEKSLRNGSLPGTVYYADQATNHARGIISHLPYFGYAEKKYIEMDKVPAETLVSLQNLIDVGLIFETEDEYQMSSEAWLWDNIIMYYLSPHSAREELDNSFLNTLSDKYYKIMELEQL